MSDWRFSLGWLSLVVILLLGLWPNEVQARQEHIVYFRDTPNELNVYRIRGRKDGPTMMIIGGIQGDEPGGFLSADLYADLALKRGNLIVVPRANFNSILLFKRGPNGDMNRKFGVKSQDNIDFQIVRILEDLMAQSDVLLNLHDGSGFYRPTHVSELANPMRYGQAIIADCDEFESPKTGQKLQLKRMAEEAVTIINPQIENSKYHFNFMNTRTSDPKSPYTEQRTSATYYALTQHGIPAFGVETSKNLPTLEMKVYQHNLAINAFMQIFGLEIEQPRIYLEKPMLRYMVLAVNDQLPMAVADGQTLTINPGDTLEVVHLEANYERGLSVDILGVGSMNDFRQKFKITSPTFIVARKDHIQFGRIPVVLRQDQPTGPSPAVTAAAEKTTPAKVDSTSLAQTTATVEKTTVTAAKVEATVPAPAAKTSTASDKVLQVKSFIFEVNGQRREVPAGGELAAVFGDVLKIVDIVTTGGQPDEIKKLVVNFKGFVSNPSNNTGEDRGVDIHTAKDLLDRYSMSKTEKVFAVVVERGRDILAKMTVRLTSPNLDYLVLSRNGGPTMRLKNGDKYKIKTGDHVRILVLKTNVPDNNGVEVKVQGRVHSEPSQDALLSFKAEREQSLTLIVIREGLTLGKIVLTPS